MTKDHKSEAAILRQKAEAFLKRNKSKSATPINEVDMQRLIHELELHQIELEMQNEELLLANERSEFSFQNYKESMPTTEELQENNLKLELAMKAAKLAWWKMDAMTGNVTFGSRKAEMLGYLPEDFSHYTDFTALLHPEDHKRTMKAMQDHLNGSVDKYEVEYRMLTKSNGYQWFYDIGSVVKKDCEGKPLVITGLVLDIGDRKRAEELILASGTRYKRLFESAKDGILILDAQTGIILEVNPFLIEMLGYSVDQFLGNEIWEIGFFKDVVANQEKFIELQQNEYVRYDNLPIKTAYGRTINIEFVSNLYFEGKKNVIQCNVREITKRKKAEDALRESEVKYRTFFENSMDAILLTNLDGKTLSVNNSACIMFGYSEGELIKLGKAGVEDISDPRLSILLAELKLKRKAQGVVTFIRKDGTHFPAEISASLFKNQENELRASMIIRDITERKKVQQDLINANIELALQNSEKEIRAGELIEAKEKAEESDRLKSAFLANMSHEVRTPLNSIIGFSELLADPDFGGDQKSEFIQHIIASGNNLLNIISDIMDISKLESGEITIRKSQINACSFIVNMIEKFSLLTEGTKLELRLILPENSEETIIFADAERLNQIFNNLISNAFKFTMKGRIEIGYQPKGNMAEFFVKDTGIGIPAEYHSKIFERFRQVENPTTRKFGGNGLGLAISKKLIELMGGKIRVVSESGLGSVFYFTLPIYHV